jgi:hypothetical protein
MQQNKKRKSDSDLEKLCFKIPSKSCKTTPKSVKFIDLVYETPCSPLLPMFLKKFIENKFELKVPQPTFPSLILLEAFIFLLFLKL